MQHYRGEILYTVYTCVYAFYTVLHRSVCSAVEGKTQHKREGRETSCVTPPRVQQALGGKTRINTRVPESWFIPPSLSLLPLKGKNKRCRYVMYAEEHRVSPLTNQGIREKINRQLFKLGLKKERLFKKDVKRNWRNSRKRDKRVRRRVSRRLLTRERGPILLLRMLNLMRTFPGLYYHAHKEKQK